MTDSERGRVAEPGDRGGRLLIAAPLRLEALLVRSNARGALVYRTGMGPARARVAATALLREPADRVLVVGFCGGLDEQSEPGEVIVAEEVRADPRPEPAGGAHGEQPRRCAGSEQLAAELSGRGLAIRHGPLVSVSRLVLGGQRKALLESGAIAVDMESLWLAEGAGGRPFGVVRIVLDSPSHELLRPAAAVGAVRAGRALRQVAAALRGWAPGPGGIGRLATGRASSHDDGPSI
jgi:4-hydroxy-3-methylbut-2-en-1-yl diphosphate reductase